MDTTEKATAATADSVAAQARCAPSRPMAVTASWARLVVATACLARANNLIAMASGILGGHYG